MPGVEAALAVRMPSWSGHDSSDVGPVRLELQRYLLGQRHHFESWAAGRIERVEAGKNHLMMPQASHPETARLETEGLRLMTSVRSCLLLKALAEAPQTSPYVESSVLTAPC